MPHASRLLAIHAPADLPDTPSRAAWQALSGIDPQPVMPAQGRCAIVVQPYFDRLALQRLREAGLPNGHANLAPSRRCSRGFRPGLMQIQELLANGLTQPTPHDLFPYLGPGAEVEARVDGMRLTQDRLQAELQLDIGGTRLTVFDAYFTQARSIYQLAHSYRFELTALASQVAPAEAAAPMRLRPARRASTRIGAEIRRVKPGAVTLLDEPLTRLNLRTWIGHQAVNLPTLAHASQFTAGWTPRCGDAITGRVWLQAQLIGPASGPIPLRPGCPRR